MKVLGSNLLGTQHTERSPVLSLYEPGPGNQPCSQKIASFTRNDEVSEPWVSHDEHVSVAGLRNHINMYEGPIVCQKDACDLYVEGQISQEVSASYLKCQIG